MIIKKNGNLDENILREMREVERICKSNDNLAGDVSLDSSLNFNQNIYNTFLYYNSNNLVSFLFIFMPTSNEAEVVGFTLPEYRQKGFFKSLLAEAISELKKYNIHKILFICETNSLSGKEVVKRMKLQYGFTEYKMLYKKKISPLNENISYRMMLHKPGVDEIEKLIYVSRQTFNDTYDDAKNLIQKSFESQSRIQYAALLDDYYIGMGSVYIEEDEATIFGLGILPQFQGKGYGKELLQLIIDDISNEKSCNIAIEVDSNNKAAFELYRKSGFEVVVAYDYYLKEIAE